MTAESPRTEPRPYRVPDRVVYRLITFAFNLPKDRAQDLRLNSFLDKDNRKRLEEIQGRLAEYYETTRPLSEDDIDQISEFVRHFQSDIGGLYDRTRNESTKFFLQCFAGIVANQVAADEFISFLKDPNTQITKAARVERTNSIENFTGEANKHAGPIQLQELYNLFKENEANTNWEYVTFTDASVDAHEKAQGEISDPEQRKKKGNQVRGSVPKRQRTLVSLVEKLVNDPKFISGDLSGFYNWLKGSKFGKLPPTAWIDIIKRELPYEQVKLMIDCYNSNTILEPKD